MDNQTRSRDEIQYLYFSYTKLPWLYPLAVGFLCAVDVLLLALYYQYTYIEEQQMMFIPLLIAHILLSILLFWLRKASSPQTRNISPMLFLLMPGIGALLYAAAYITLYILGSNTVQLGLKHEYSKDDISYEKSVSIDFNQVNKLMDMSGVFSYASAINKKEAIVDLLSSDVARNCRMLQKGLLDDDVEVVHYTASTLNYLENRFEKAIREARDTAAAELTLEHLDQLVLLYENYIDSGLLDDDIKPMYHRKVIEVLELELKEFGSTVHVARLLAQAYLRQGRHQEAVTLLLAAVESYPDDMDLKFTLMRYYYEKGDLLAVQQTAEQIDSSDVTLTKDQQRLIAFWLFKEGPAGERAETAAL
jgi:tetratricopeptide (TPR) repeat protein